MAIVSLTEQQLADALTLIERGLDDMEHQEKQGDLEVDGYTDADKAERERVKASGAQLLEVLQLSEAYGKASASLKDHSDQSSALARMTVEAFSVETGVAEKDTDVLATPALRDLLIDLFHFTELNDVDLNDEFDRARTLWEEEVYDEQQA
jgi:hypothetical protein